MAGEKRNFCSLTNAYICDAYTNGEYEKCGFYKGRTDGVCFFLNRWLCINPEAQKAEQERRLKTCMDD